MPSGPVTLFDECLLPVKRYEHRRLVSPLSALHRIKLRRVLVNQFFGKARIKLAPAVLFKEILEEFFIQLPSSQFLNWFARLLIVCLK